MDPQDEIDLERKKGEKTQDRIKIYDRRIPNTLSSACPWKL